MSRRSAPIRASVDPEAAIHRARRLRPTAASGSASTAKQKPDRGSARLLLVVLSVSQIETWQHGRIRMEAFVSDAR